MGGRSLATMAGALAATALACGAALAQPLPPPPPMPPAPPAPPGMIAPPAPRTMVVVPPAARTPASRGLLSPRPPAQLRGDNTGWTLNVGGGALARPAYIGADTYKISPIPAAAVTYNDWFFADPAQGLGVRQEPIAGVQVNGGATWRFGRDEDDDSRLEGLGDLEGGAAAFASVEIRPFGGLLRALSAQMDIEAPFTGDIGGAEVSADLAVAIPIGNGGYASFSAGAAWMTEEMMDDIFGITPAQAASSIFPAYDPDGGLRAYRFGASALRPLWGKWSLLATIGYDRLVNDAAASPIAATNDQYRAGAGVLYRFGD